MVLKGIAAAPGQALGPVLVYRRPTGAAKVATIAPEQVASEQKRVGMALEAAEVELERLAEDVKATVGESEAAIFEAQALMIADPTLGDRAKELVEMRQIDADAAIVAAAEEQASMLAELDDAYLRERAADLRDVGERAARLARGEVQSHDLSKLEGPAIILAEDSLALGDGAAG